MRIAVLSDIHGNVVALDAVLADMALRGPFEQTIVAGDLVWSGPWPAEVVDRIRELRGPVIQGNTDAFFVRQAHDTPEGKNQERFAAQLNWMCEQLGPERVAYLAGLPFSHRLSPAAGHDLLVVHANPWDLERPVIPQMPEEELDELLLPAGGRRPDWEVLAFGHVHVPFVRTWRGRLLIDVASAGLPMDGDPRAAYAILTWDGRNWSTEHRRVSYELRVVAHAMRAGGMPRGKHFAERLLAASYGSFAPVLAVE